MALTAIEAKAAKPTGKPFKLSDGGGLYLLVQPNGSKYWRLDYRFAGKRAYSRPNWTPIPRQTGQAFHGKVDTDSSANWTVEL